MVQPAIQFVNNFFEKMFPLADFILAKAFEEGYIWVSVN